MAYLWLFYIHGYAIYLMTKTHSAMWFDPLYERVLPFRLAAQSVFFSMTSDNTHIVNQD